MTEHRSIVVPPPREPQRAGLAEADAVAETGALHVQPAVGIGAPNSKAVTLPASAASWARRARRIQ